MTKLLKMCIPVNALVAGCSTITACAEIINLPVELLVLRAGLFAPPGELFRPLTERLVLLAGVLALEPFREVLALDVFLRPAAFFLKTPAGSHVEVKEGPADLVVADNFALVPFWKAGEPAPEVGKVYKAVVVARRPPTGNPPKEQDDGKGDRH